MAFVWKDRDFPHCYMLAAWVLTMIVDDGGFDCWDVSVSCPDPWVRVSL